MPGLSRRQALLAVTTGIATLAGCTGDGDRPTLEDGNVDRIVENYEVRRVRNEDGAVLFGPGEELPTPSDDERDPMARRGRTVIVSAERYAELTFGDLPEAEELQAFIEATDFDSSSVYLLTYPVEACYELHLRSVAVESDSGETDDLHPHAGFCRSYRPADVACPLEEIHTIGVAIRLPMAAERASGSGGSMSSTCGPSPRGEYFNASVSPLAGDEG